MNCTKKHSFCTKMLFLFKFNYLRSKIESEIREFRKISGASRRSFPAAWTTATCCSSATWKDWWTGCSPFRTPLLTSALSAALATSATTRPLRGGHVRPPVVVWRFAIVPGRRLPPCRRCSWSAAAFHSEPNMRRDADIQHLWRQSVLGCWTRTVEQSSIAPERCWLIVQWIPAVAKDISVWTVGDGAVWTLLRRLEIFVLTYLLSYLELP